MNDDEIIIRLDNGCPQWDSERLGLRGQMFDWKVDDNLRALESYLRYLPGTTTMTVQVSTKLLDQCYTFRRVPYHRERYSVWSEYEVKLGEQYRVLRFCNTLNTVLGRDLYSFPLVFYASIKHIEGARLP